MLLNSGEVLAVQLRTVLSVYIGSVTMCITTNQLDTKSNTNPNPNPTTKQHAIVSIQLNIVTCPTRQCHCTVFTTFRCQYTGWPKKVSRHQFFKKIVLKIANEIRFLRKVKV